MFCFCVFPRVFPQTVSSYWTCEISSCLEVSKLQILMSKQLCQSMGEAITVLQFICWLADASPWKQRLEADESDPAKNFVHLGIQRFACEWERCLVHETGCLFVFLFFFVCVFLFFLSLYSAFFLLFSPRRRPVPYKSSVNCALFRTQIWRCLRVSLCAWGIRRAMPITIHEQLCLLPPGGFAPVSSLGGGRGPTAVCGKEESAVAG